DELPDDFREGISCLEMLERLRQSQTTSEALGVRSADARQSPTLLDAPATQDRLGTSAEVEVPVQLGRFQIRRVLGQGGCGIVFLAYDPSLHRLVAIKIPRPEGLLTAELRQRFLREGRASAHLDHPNIATVFEAGEFGSICYLASAYCPGVSLREWLRQHGGSVPPRVAANLVATLADAMHYAHQKGI